MSRQKVYVGVNVDHRPDGSCHLNSVTFRNGVTYQIERVRNACRTASVEVSGAGIRYTIVIRGRDTYLFDEENGKWFVEAKAGEAK